MDISVLGMAELADYEALILSPYIDSGGVKTVGVGSTISDIPDLPNWPWDRILTIEEAFAYYRKGLQKYVTALNRAITRLDVPQNQFDALVSITYNIGIGAMQKSTFLKLVNQDAPPSQIVAAMARYKYDNGKIVQGLINRRAKEAKLFLTGEYTSNGWVSLVPVNSSHKPVYKLAKRINVLNYLEETKKETPKPVTPPTKELENAYIEAPSTWDGVVSFLKKVYEVGTYWPK